jgi:hypothetical protein
MMSFLRPVQWNHSHADPIWPDGNFKKLKTSFQDRELDTC